jgi:hypothetical protein
MNFRLPRHLTHDVGPIDIGGFLTYIETRKVRMEFQPTTERRIYRRNMSLNSLQFCFDHDAPAKTRMGATVNVSHSGMCLVTSSQLKEGEYIFIKSDLSLLASKAVVRWVKNYQQNFCKAGLQFIEQ